jgi:hypothetical protein
VKGRHRESAAVGQLSRGYRKGACLVLIGLIIIARTHTDHPDDVG